MNDVAAGHPDWTGVAPEQTPIEPLDARTFAIRLVRLSERARDLTVLRAAVAAQHEGAAQPRRNSDTAVEGARGE